MKDKFLELASHLSELPRKVLDQNMFVLLGKAKELEAESSEIKNLVTLEFPDLIDNRAEKDKILALTSYNEAFWTVISTLMENLFSLLKGRIDEESLQNIEDKLSKNLLLTIQSIDKKESSSLMWMLIVNILLIFIAGIIGYFISKNILIALKEMNKVSNELAKGNLTKELHINSNDEIGETADEMNNFIHSVKETIINAKNSSTENVSISHELSVTALSVGQNVEHSMTIISEASERANAIKYTIEDAISDAKESKEDIIKANDTLDEARNDIIGLTSKVQESVEMEVELAGRMSELSTDAEEVKSILSVISEIADQTNLLALNAAIEAARAGEHGRGFAVVADEVRKLAERTQGSLTEINATINVIVQSIVDASTQMENNSKEVQTLANIAMDVEVKITDTVEIVNSAVAASDKTVQDFITTGESINEVVSKVENINELSSKNTRSVEEIASAAEHLNSLTENLNAELDTFKT